MRYRKKFLRRLRHHKTAHARYVGPRDDLRGCTALVRQAPNGSSQVLVQFDDLKRFGDGGLAHGWHLFRAAEFKLCDTPRSLRVTVWSDPVQRIKK